MKLYFVSVKMLSLYKNFTVTWLITVQIFIFYYQILVQIHLDGVRVAHLRHRKLISTMINYNGSNQQ